MSTTLVPNNSLLTQTPEDGRALAIKPKERALNYGGAGIDGLGRAGGRRFLRRSDGGSAR